MNRTCINLHGLMQYEIEMTKKMSALTRRPTEVILEEYSPRERWVYCSFHCPVQQRCKFESKYRINLTNKNI